VERHSGDFVELPYNLLPTQDAEEEKHGDTCSDLLLSP